MHKVDFITFSCTTLLDCHCSIPAHASLGPTWSACCRIILPNIWTSVRTIAFGFTPFAAAPGVRLEYAWGLGSGPYDDDVVTMRAFNGTVQVCSNLPDNMFSCLHCVCQLPYA